MAATLGSLVEGVLDQLYGHGAVQDATAYLAEPLSDTALTVVVEDAREVGKGLVEIDSELLRVKSVDLGSQTVTFAARGVRGSTAAAHATGAEMRIAPVVPYHSVAREVNAEISSLFPFLCKVESTEFQSSTTTVDHEIPADAEMVLDVRYKDQIGNWERVRRWEPEESQNTDSFTTGRSIRIWTPDLSTVRVVYGKRFGSLSAMTDTLADTGVPESCEDIIRMGALLRLLPSLDLARYSVVSNQSADTTSKSPQPGTGVMVAREVKANYRERREQEVGAFRTRFPVRQHYTR